MMTVNKLSVGSLSAISANIGNVTAGTITGVNINGSVITAGGSGGDVTVNSSGISIVAGTGASQKVKWSDGSAIYGAGSAVFVESGGGAVVARAGSAQLQWNSDGSLTGHVVGDSIGLSSNRWGSVYAQNLDISNGIVFGGADSQNAGIGRPLVVASDGFIHGVNNGLSGSFSGGTFTFENGICTGHA